VFGALVFQKTVVTTEIVEVGVIEAYNDTALKNDVTNIQATLDEQDTWDADAKKLAVTELEDDDYERLFEFLVEQNISIEDENDMEVIIKDSDVTSSDVDEKDATITHELKVYYEPVDAEDRLKVYVDVTTEIVDGEVEEQSFTLA
jgi:hypothetical protein